MQISHESDPPELTDPACLVGLLYTSVAHAEMDALKWEAMVSAAQLRNEALEITGALLIRSNLVVQWLEGPAAQVAQLWESIASDPRHHSLAKLWFGALPQGRMFAAWRMLPASASRADMAALVQATLQPKYRAYDVAGAGTRSSGDLGAQAELSAAPIVSLLLDPHFEFSFSQYLR